MSEEILAVEALKEQVDMLYEVIGRYRRSNALLRKINSALRGQLAIAHRNDEEFKSMDFCIEIEANVIPAEGGLPKAGSSPTGGVQHQGDVSND